MKDTLTNAADMDCINRFLRRHGSEEEGRFRFKLALAFEPSGTKLEQVRYLENELKLLIQKHPGTSTFVMKNRYIVGLSNLEPRIVHYVAAGGKPGCGMVVMNAKLANCHGFSRQGFLNPADPDKDNFPSVDGVGEVWELERNKVSCSHLSPDN